MVGGVDFVLRECGGLVGVCEVVWGRPSAGLVGEGMGC